MTSKSEIPVELNDAPAGRLVKFSHTSTAIKILGLGCYIEPGATAYSAELTPAEGLSFELKVVSTNGNSGTVSLKNCGSAKVRFRKFRLEPGQNEKCNFELEPDGSIDIQDFHFKDYYIKVNSIIKVVCELELFVQRDLESYTEFVSDIGKMKDITTFADGVLVCQNQELECHRVILAARSEHFRNMFANTGFVEGRSQRIEVKGMDLSTLREMLSFIYMNEFNKEKADIPSLFSAADQYQILGLIARCESLMIEQMSIENVAEFFHKSFLHESAKLKSASMDFIFKNFAAVKATDGWAVLKRSPKSSDALELILNFVIKN